MKDEEVFRYDPRRQTLERLIEQAKQSGISISPYKEIFVKRRDWKAGIQKVRETSTGHNNFRAALRSFDHAIEEIRGRINTFQLCRVTVVDSFARVSAKSNPTDKAQIAYEAVEFLLSHLKGVRRRNPVLVKRNLAGDEEDRKTLEELIEDRNWPASASKVLKIRDGLDREIRELLCMIPKIGVKKRLLGMIWDHDKQQIRSLREQAVAFLQIYNEAWLEEKGMNLVLVLLDNLVDSLSKQFYHDLRIAARTFTKMAQGLRNLNGFSDSTRKLLLRGLEILKRHEEWLLEDNPSEEEQDPARILPFPKITKAVS